MKWIRELFGTKSPEVVPQRVGPQQLGGTLLRNLPPNYDRDLSVEANWRRFFEWGLELRQPHITIPEVPGAEVIRHPIGFTAVYLTERSHGQSTSWVRGVIRANVIEPGVTLRDDIHSHGYDFTSGVVSGEVTNNRYTMDFSKQVPGGEGYIGYETKPDFYGVNHVVQATDAVIAIPSPEVAELEIGDSYSMLATDDFHSLQTSGAVTIFGKYAAGSATLNSNKNLSLILRPADQPPPPPEY